MQPSISERILERFFTELANTHPDGEELAAALRQATAEEQVNLERALTTIYQQLGRPST